MQNLLVGRIRNSYFSNSAAKIQIFFNICKRTAESISGNFAGEAKDVVAPLYQKHTNAWYEEYQALVLCLPHCGIACTALWSYTDHVVVVLRQNCGRGVGNVFVVALGAYAFMAATPGNSLPSIASSRAPPPVEI